MEIKRGIAVSPGVAIGPALVLDTEWYRIPQRFVPPSERDAEVARLRRALEESAREARQSQEAVTARLRPQSGALFAASAVMLADPPLAPEVEALIREQPFSAEYAASRVMRRHAKALENIGGVMAERVSDVFDLEKRILGHLLGQRREQMRRLSEPVI